MEHGFTVDSPLTTKSDHGVSKIDLSFETNLEARMMVGPEGERLIAFFGESDRPSFYYHTLTVFDNNGKKLPSSLQFERKKDTETVISLVFDDTSATYPITIDPFISTSLAELPGNRGNSTLSDSGDVIYFGGGMEDTGLELWRTDGTPEGTFLVKDIRPGPKSSNPSSFIRLGGKLLFRADDGVNGAELWITDGTTEGTSLLKDINPGPDYSSPVYPELVNGMVIFHAQTADEGRELWQTDGTREGTKMIKDIYPGPEDGYHVFTRLVDAGGKFYFVGNSGSPKFKELWVTDGTTEGTFPINETYDGHEVDSPEYLTEFGEELYFTGSVKPITGGSLGREICKSDGTIDGTALVEDIMPGSTSSWPSTFYADDNFLYFVAEHPERGIELFRTTGEPGETIVLTDRSGNPSSDPTSFRRTETGVFFMNSTVEDGYQPWHSEGSPETTGIIKKLNADGDLFPLSTSSYDGNVLFVVDDGVHGPEIWSTDGTDEGTALVKDINPGPPGSFQLVPFYSPIHSLFLKFEDKLLIPANDGIHGFEYWITDGTEAGTRLLKDINPGPATSYPSVLNHIGDKFLFLGDDGIHGEELWISDGTEEGTRLVADINTVSQTEFAEFNELIFFSGADSQHGTELWISDGTEVGTRLFKDLNPGPNSSYPSHLTIAGSFLYFTVKNTNGLWELWKTDGTVDGTLHVSALIAAEESESGTEGPTLEIIDAEAVGSTLYLTTVNESSDPILWKSGGLSENTLALASFERTAPYLMMMTEFEGGIYFCAQQSGQTGIWRSRGNATGAITNLHLSLRSHPYVFNDDIFFANYSSQTGTELWIIDDSLEGASLVKDVSYERSSSPIEFAACDSSLFFFNGNSLWKTDGTTEGTLFIKRPNPLGASDISNLLCLDKKIYFFAQDETEQRALWRSDGTEEGTIPIHLLADEQDIDAELVTKMVVLDGTIYFAADDGIHGVELWMSDGTKNGTRRLSDDFKGPGSSLPIPVSTRDGDLLYFSTGGPLDSWRLRRGTYYEDGDPALFQPDLLAGYNDSTMRGNGDYDSPSETLFFTSRRAKPVIGYFQVENDGLLPTEMMWSGSRGNSLFRVIYQTKENKNITSEVTTGTYTDDELAYAEKGTEIRVSVYPNKRKIRKVVRRGNGKRRRKRVKYLRRTFITNVSVKSVQNDDLYDAGRVIIRTR